MVNCKLRPSAIAFYGEENEIIDNDEGEYVSNRDLQDWADYIHYVLEKRRNENRHSCEPTPDSA